MSEEVLSCHDHGNCELCDEIERRLAAAEARAEQAERELDAERLEHLSEIARRQACAEEITRLRAVVEEIRAALAPAEIWDVNGVPRVLHAVDGDALSRVATQHILYNVLCALARAAAEEARGE